MYHAKHDGRNHFRFFTSDMHARRRAPCCWKTRCAVRWSASSCTLHYQPQAIFGATGAIMGA